MSHRWLIPFMSLPVSWIVYESSSPVCASDSFVLFLCFILSNESFYVMSHLSLRALTTLLTLTKTHSRDFHSFDWSRSLRHVVLGLAKTVLAERREEAYSSTPNNTKGKRIFRKKYIIFFCQILEKKHHKYSHKFKIWENRKKIEMVELKVWENESYFWVILVKWPLLDFIFEFSVHLGLLRVYFGVIFRHHSPFLSHFRALAQLHNSFRRNYVTNYLY